MRRTTSKNRLIGCVPPPEYPGRIAYPGLLQALTHNWEENAFHLVAPHREKIAGWAGPFPHVKNYPLAEVFAFHVT